MEDAANAEKASSIFGGAKPVNTAAKEREIEERLNRQKQQEKERWEQDREQQRRYAGCHSDQSGFHAHPSCHGDTTGMLCHLLAGLCLVSFFVCFVHLCQLCNFYVLLLWFYINVLF